MVFDDTWREGKEREENWSKCIYAVDESLSEGHQFLMCEENREHLNGTRTIDKYERNQ